MSEIDDDDFYIEDYYDKGYSEQFWESIEHLHPWEQMKEMKILLSFDTEREYWQDQEIKIKSMEELLGISDKDFM